MDAVAVAALSGMAQGRASWREALSISAVFGLFQAAMPAIGYAGGALFRDAIADYDHWVAFALLAAVGAHMIKESREAHDERPQGYAFAPRRLLLLGFATSIDALAVGISLALLEVNIWLTATVIGVITFVLSTAAVFIGHRVGVRYQRPAEIIGGVILIGIGILVEHLSA